MADQKAPQPDQNEANDSPQQAEDRNRAFIEQLIAANSDIEVLSGEIGAGESQDDSADASDAAQQDEADSDAQASGEQLDQDAIDQMMAAREAQAAQKQPPQQEGQDESPAEEEGGDQLDQDAVDRMMAAREEQAAQKHAEEQTVAADELDQDAIDQMMAARAAGAEDAAPAQEPADPGTADQAGQARDVDSGDDLDQEVINAMLAARQAQPKSAAEGVGDRQPSGKGRQVSTGRASWMQWAMLINSMLALGVLATLLVLRMTNDSPTQPPEANAANVQQTGPAGADEPNEMAVAREMQASHPVTWSEAEAAYADGKWATAMPAYMQLLRRAKATGSEMLVDLIRLRIGQCFDALEEFDRARNFLRRAAESGSPIIRAVANYRLGRIHVRTGQFLEGRRKAYQALASLGLVGTPSALEGDCDYLAAQAITEKVLWFDNPESPLLPPAPDGHD
ncbi:MAG: hypothetical protein ACOC93_05675, partial [Planctomycetota bacterium]